MPHEDQPSLQRPRYGSIVDDERLSAEEMDERRRQNIAYEYLCHLEEAKSLVSTKVRKGRFFTTEPPGKPHHRGFVIGKAEINFTRNLAVLAKVGLSRKSFRNNPGLLRGLLFSKGTLFGGID
ncbi:hypothetical protein MG293_009127 [Ovis ammon polii]|uniref:Uncharacterized protein n=1 Tax=Ovis ammon polii TaxID=230172 RepID=A0AAD4YB52_OVIAM|nr:hypothetical protein MG293_009127 [Ovis ammon polii]